jgi:hypothetical protein
VHFVEKGAVVRIAGNLAGEVEDRGDALDGGSAVARMQNRPFDHLDAARSELGGARASESLEPRSISVRPFEETFDEVGSEESRRSGDENLALHDFFAATAGFSAFFSSRSL